jgi:hypothetical protein
VDPDFIGQKRQRLQSFVWALRSGGRLPGLGVNCLGKNDRGTEQYQAHQSSFHVDLLFLAGVAGWRRADTIGHLDGCRQMAMRRTCSRSSICRRMLYFAVAWSAELQ